MHASAVRIHTHIHASREAQTKALYQMAWRGSRDEKAENRKILLNESRNAGCRFSIFFFLEFRSMRTECGRKCFACPNGQMDGQGPCGPALNGAFELDRRKDIALHARDLWCEIGRTKPKPSEWSTRHDGSKRNCERAPRISSNDCIVQFAGRHTRNQRASEHRIGYRLTVILFHLFNLFIHKLRDWGHTHNILKTKKREKRRKKNANFIDTRWIVWTGPGLRRRCVCARAIAKVVRSRESPSDWQLYKNLTVGHTIPVHRRLRDSLGIELKTEKMSCDALCAVQH